jgi:hypothetical protein
MAILTKRLLSLQKKKLKPKDKEEEERAKAIEEYSKKVRPRFYE